MSGQSITPMPMMKGPTMLNIAITVLSLQPCNRLLLDHWLLGAGEDGVSVEGDLATNPEKCTAFCGEDKGHTTRTCQVTIQKQKENAKAEAR
jgi:hypothetical protein